MKTLPLTATCLAVLAGQPALAHTELSATVPADRATIEAAPENVELSFSEPVRLTALTIQLDAAPKQSLGPLPSETAASFSVALPKLADGHYVVTWRALSEDTHVMNGEFMFSIGTDGGHDAHVDRDEAAGHDAGTPH